MAFNYSPKPVIDSSLVLYLDAANPKSYVSGSTVWTDVSRGGNTGTLNNMGSTGYTSSNGGSLVFGGVDDYVLTTFSLNGVNPLTVSCWFKLNTVTKNWQSMVDAFKDVSDRNFQMWVNSNSKLYIYHLGNAHTGDGLLSQNIWYNAVFTYNGSGNGILYLNNLVINASVPKGSGVGGNIPINIGRRTDADASSYTNGNISNIMIYNRALTATEVSKNYNALKGRYGLK
jgi:hypothetical protein